MKLAGVLLFLFVGCSVVLAGVAVLLSAVFLVELSYLERRRRRPEARSVFGEKLLHELTSRAIRDIVDVYNSYRSFLGIEVLRASHLEEIGEFLRGAISQTVAAHSQLPSAQVHGDTRVVEELLAANERTLEVEMHCVPFSGTPEPERQLLEDILDLTAGDDRPAMAKLGLLAKVIRVRQDTLERLSRESARSLRLARWGWLGTAGFSILSIILGMLVIGE